VLTSYYIDYKISKPRPGTSHSKDCTVPPCKHMRRNRPSGLLSNRWCVGK
jgi:hypothetical protein